MKIKKSSKKSEIILIIAVFAAGTMAMILAHLLNSQQINSNEKGSRVTSSDGSGPESASDEQKRAGDAIKKSSIEKEISKPSTQSNQVEVTIASNDIVNGNLKIRTAIKYITSSGTCILELSKSGEKSITKTVGVQPLSNISTCQGFDIATKGLSQGTWQATVSYEGDQHKGAATKSIEIY